MAYYVGDIPAEDLVIEPARDGEPIDLALFNSVDTEVVLRDFNGEEVAADFLVAFQADPDAVVLEWPAASVFESPGLYTLAVTLGNGTHRERLAPIYLVAQGDDGWHTIDSTRAEWTTGGPTSDHVLHTLLELARQQVLAYAPALAEDAPVPANYRAGQLMQTQNLWNAGRASTTGDDGEDGFTLTIRPLDWIVTQILRPKKALGSIA